MLHQAHRHLANIWFRLLVHTFSSWGCGLWFWLSSGVWAVFFAKWTPNDAFARSNVSNGQRAPRVLCGRLGEWSFVVGLVVWLRLHALSGSYLWNPFGSFWCLHFFHCNACSLDQTATRKSSPFPSFSFLIKTKKDNAERRAEPQKVHTLQLRPGRRVVSEEKMGNGWHCHTLPDLVRANMCELSSWLWGYSLGQQKGQEPTMINNDLKPGLQTQPGHLMQIWWVCGVATAGV